MKLHALALIASLSMTGWAHATPVTINDSKTLVAGNDSANLGSFGPGINYHGVILVSSSMPATFIHTLTFGITTPLNANSSVADIQTSSLFGPFTFTVTDITGIGATIYDGNNNHYASFTATNNNLDYLTLPSNTYFAVDGNYKLVVTGTTAGVLGSSYEIKATTVPVPEPETYAMLLVGLGLVGYRLHQKNRTAGQTSLN